MAPFQVFAPSEIEGEFILVGEFETVEAAVDCADDDHDRHVEFREGGQASILDL